LKYLFGFVALAPHCGQTARKNIDVRSNLKTGGLICFKNFVKVDPIEVEPINTLFGWAHNQNGCISCKVRIDLWGEQCYQMRWSNDGCVLRSLFNIGILGHLQNLFIELLDKKE